MIPCFFFEEDIDGFHSEGIICSISSKYFGNIHTHEKTYENKVEDLCSSFLLTSVQQTPILLISDDDRLLDLIEQLKSSRITSDRSDNLTKQKFKKLQELIDPIMLQGKLTVADGHHRFQALQQLCSRYDLKTSIFAAITHYSFVNLYRNVLLLKSHVSKSQVLKELGAFCDIELVTSTHDVNITYIYIDKKWHRMNIDIITDKYRLASEVFMEEIFPRTNFFVNNLCSFQIISEDDTSLDKALLDDSCMILILPRTCPSVICNIGQQGRLVKQNSTSFVPKFTECPLLHNIFRV